MSKHEVRESTGQVYYGGDCWRELEDGEPFVTLRAALFGAAVLALMLVAIWFWDATTLLRTALIAATVLGVVVAAIWLGCAAVHAIGG